MPWLQIVKDVVFWGNIIYWSFYGGGSLAKMNIERQKTISDHPVNPPLSTPDFHPTKVEAPLSYRNPYSSKGILDNVLSNPPAHTINTRLDDISSIYTAPDATYFCMGTEIDSHYFQSRPADEGTLTRLIEHQPVVWEDVLASTVVTQVVYKDREQIDYGGTLIDWGFNHWIRSAGMILFCLNFRYKWATRWLAQEQRHRRERQQMQQHHRDQITSKDEDYFRMVVALDLLHKQAFDELKEKHDQKIIEKDVSSSRGIDELKANHNRVISEVEAKVQELEEVIIYKENAHRHKQGVTRDHYLEKAKNLEERQAGERKRLGQLPENYTKGLKENHASELDRVKQLHEQELSHKDTQLQKAKNNHKKGVEAKEKETQCQIKKKDEEISAKTQQITAVNLKAAKADREKKDEIKALKKELEISDATAQKYKTASRTATRSSQKQDEEIRHLNGRILDHECSQRITNMFIKEWHSQTAQNERRGELLLEQNKRIQTLERFFQQKIDTILKLKADHKSSENAKDEEIRKLIAKCKSLNIRVTGIKELEAETEKEAMEAVSRHEKEVKALENKIEEQKREIEDQKRKYDTTLTDLRRNSRLSHSDGPSRNGGSRCRNVPTPRDTNTTIPRSNLSQVVSQEGTTTQASEQRDVVAHEATVQPAPVQQPTIGTTQQDQGPPTQAAPRVNTLTTATEVRPRDRREQQKVPGSLLRQLQENQQKQAERVRTPVQTHDDASRPVEDQRVINNKIQLSQAEEELKKMDKKPVARKLSFEKTTKQDQSSSPTRATHGASITATQSQLQSAVPTPKQTSSPSFLGSVLQSIEESSPVQDITITGNTSNQIFGQLAQQGQMKDESRSNQTLMKELHEATAADKPAVYGPVEQTPDELIDPALLALDGMKKPVQDIVKRAVKSLVEEPTTVGTKQGFSASLLQEQLKRQQQRQRQALNHGNDTDDDTDDDPDDDTDDDDEAPSYVDEPEQTNKERYSALEKGKWKEGQEELIFKAAVEQTPDELIDPALLALDVIEKPVEKPVIFSIPRGYADAAHHAMRQGRQQTFHEERDGSVDDEETQEETAGEKPVEQKPVEQFIRTSPWIPAATTFGSTHAEERNEEPTPIAQSPLQQMRLGTQTTVQQEQPHESMEETKKQIHTPQTPRDPQFEGMFVPDAPGRERAVADDATMARRRAAREAEKKAKQLRSRGRRP